MTHRFRALAVAAIALHAAAAFAGEIYRCQVNGVTTFVDSPHGCPGAQRVGGESGAAKAPPAPTPAVASSACQKLAQDPARARECIRAERRAEVRRVAEVRLAEISRAVADYVNAAASAGNIMAVSRDGRPAAWCENLLGDLIARKDIEVVDDETVGGPEWTTSGNGPGRAAADILDPAFKEWNLGSATVPEGYVTARWRTSNLVVLRVTAACTQARDGTARCNPHRLVNVYVHDTATPVACDATEVSRAAWPNWKNAKTPIFEHSTGR